MAQYDFTVIALEEVKVSVSVEADSEEEARKKARSGVFSYEERQEATGIRAYEITSFDGLSE